MKFTGKRIATAAEMSLNARANQMGFNTFFTKLDNVYDICHGANVVFIGTLPECHKWLDDPPKLPAESQWRPSDAKVNR